MPSTPLPDEARELTEAPNPAVIATVRPDGQPVSVATWYRWDGDRILVNMDESRRRLSYLREEPRVSLTVLADGDWYTHVSLQGRVVEMADDADLSGIDSLSRHYTGNAYPVRDRRRVNAWIEVESWHGWGRMRQD
jgi:PPOX class probable F420-dependent enzyme